MDFLGDFEFDIKHIKGIENKLENILSRHANAIMEIFASSAITNFTEQIWNSIQEHQIYQQIQYELKLVEITGYTKNLENLLT